MSLQAVPASERVHIGFFGARNAGKSSLVNAVTGQAMSIVSEVAGTTTDAVSKSMELLPLGPVVITDTAGYDDDDVSLGAERVARTRRALYGTDLAVLVVSGNDPLRKPEHELIALFDSEKIPYLLVRSKADTLREDRTQEGLYVSSKTGEGIHELKETLAHMAKGDGSDSYLVRDMLKVNEAVVLVTPIDASAPKGRLILPQQQLLREVLDANAIPLVTQTEQLDILLHMLNTLPRMVITDSQVFKQVAEIVPDSIPLTSFSILMARYKGFLKTALAGVRAVKGLPGGAEILIAEGCTHHRQCNDIGTVKLPRALQTYAGKTFRFYFCSGAEFPEDLSGYQLVVHCGGCMRTTRELRWRMHQAERQGVPFTNYGVMLAECNGILTRCIAGIDIE